MRPLLVSGLLFAVALTAGCDNLNRLSEVGSAPSVAPISNPTTDPNWRTVSMPMPALAPELGDTPSLFRGSRTFLRDQRAASVGDLVTVLVQIEDRAQLANTTSRSRDNSESLGVPNLFGLENSVRRIAPSVIDPASLVDLSSANSSTGSGAIQRREQVTLRVATTVVQTLPNGNLVVAGRQQVRVNSELRDLAVTATATDPRTVVVSLAGRDAVGLTAGIEQLRILPDQPARVVIEEASGTIVIGNNVRVSTVAIAQGSLTIRVTETPVVSQPGAFSAGETVVAPRTNIEVEDQSNRRLALLQGGVTLQDLVSGLNALGVGPREIMTILQTIKAAGALQAELELR